MKRSNYIVLGITVVLTALGLYSTTFPYSNTSYYTQEMNGYRGAAVQKLIVYQTVRQGGSTNYTSTTDYSSSSSSSSSYSSYDDDDYSSSSSSRSYSGGGSSYGK